MTNYSEWPYADSNKIRMIVRLEQNKIELNKGKEASFPRLFLEKIQSY